MTDTPRDTDHQPDAADRAKPASDASVAAKDPGDVVDAPATSTRLRLLIAAPAVTLTALVTVIFLMFLLVEPSPRWVILFGSAITTLAMDGILRSVRREAFETAGIDTAPFLFLPALYVLIVPVFIEHAVRGYWIVPAGVTAGVAFGVVVAGMLSSIREHDPARDVGRFITTAAAYFVVFALLSLTYTFELDLRSATLAVGLGSMLLAVEVLRDGEIDPLDTLVYAAITGVIVAELRWTLHFLPLAGHLAALTLLLAFYFVTGLVHSHLTRHLDRVVAGEHSAIVAAGLLLVAGARAAGIA